MNYLSTRGQTPPVPFRQAVLMGLADDGGLLVPERIPDFSTKLDRLAGLDYQGLALELMAPFVGDLSRTQLKTLIDRSYGPDYGKDVAHLVQAGPVYVLELFHGPTLAFKDVALQFLGHLLQTILETEDAALNVLVATSGDTGSAAIYGLRGRARIKIFVMHPQGRISALQERQMTTVLDPNVFNLAIEGSFDDCQGILKELSSDLELKQRVKLGAVNSVNWARVLAQLVYYFWAALQVRSQTGAERIQFSVPTGNFGNILAGWYARRMGLPVERLILGTNDNDILARYFQTGVYSRGPVHRTLAPAMDIQVASNFERYLYYRLGENSDALAQEMDGFRARGEIRMEGRDPLFIAAPCGREELLSTIATFHKDYDYLLDPHTAVGVAVAQRHAQAGLPVVCLATAHPAKFPEAINEALGASIATHPSLEALAGRPTRLDVLPNQAEAVRRFMETAVAPPAGKVTNP